MKSKICTICNISKNINDFSSRKDTKDGRRNNCKECEKKQMNKYYKENKEILNEKSKIYREKNRESLLEKQRTNYEKNRESIKKYDRIRHRKNKEKNKERAKKYYQENKKEILIRVKKYSKDNKEKAHKYSKKYYKNNKEKKILYIKNRKKIDPLFALSLSVRNVIYKSFKRNGYEKRSRTYEILGCTFEEFKFHIEKQFENWMTWENYGKYNGELNYGWDIDHIIPISSAKKEEEILDLNHYTNLQPLCSKINRDIKKQNILRTF